MAKKKPAPVASIKHKDKRANIPTRELRGFVEADENKPMTSTFAGLLYARDPSLDPQLVWKGKDELDRSELTVPCVPIYIQEKIHPHAIINDIAIAKEAELTGQAIPERPTENDIKKGFVYKRVPHVTLKAIANNEEIDTIHAKWQQKLEPVRAELNKLLKEAWEEWQVPREAEEKWTAKAKEVLANWWKLRRERQKEIDESIARRADTETLYDQPYEDKNRIRVTGPFTVESLSPHRVLAPDLERPKSEEAARKDTAAVSFDTMILDNLRKAGVQNTKKKERLKFDRLEPYTGVWLHAAGDYTDADGKSKRAAVSIGPEHGTVSPQQVKEAAKEAVKGAGFDILLVCGFAFDPHVAEEAKQYRHTPNATRAEITEAYLCGLWKFVGMGHAMFVGTIKKVFHGARELKSFRFNGFSYASAVDAALTLGQEILDQAFKISASATGSKAKPDKSKFPDGAFVGCCDELCKQLAAKLSDLDTSAISAAIELELSAVEPTEQPGGAPGEQASEPLAEVTPPTLAEQVPADSAGVDWQELLMMPPLSAAEIAERLGQPVDLVQRTLNYFRASREFGFIKDETAGVGDSRFRYKMPDVLAHLQTWYAKRLKKAAKKRKPTSG